MAHGKHSKAVKSSFLIMYFQQPILTYLLVQYAYVEMLRLFCSKCNSSDACCPGYSFREVLFFFCSFQLKAFMESQENSSSVPNVGENLLKLFMPPHPHYIHLIFNRFYLNVRYLTPEMFVLLAHSVWDHGRHSVSPC